MAVDPMEAEVTAKTTKAQLIDMLQELRNRVRRSNDSRAEGVKELEERLRARWGDRNTEPLTNVIVSCTKQEWDETIEFLSDLEDVLPTPLMRLLIGGRVLQEQVPTTTV